MNESNFIYRNHQPRKFDELYTPEYAVYPIVQRLNEFQFEINKHLKILEPFSNGHNIAKILRQERYEVIETHLESGQDFFDIDKDFLKKHKIDVIVSNPPYSIKNQVLQHTFDLDIPFIYLLPINVLSSKKRSKMLWDRIEDISIVIYDGRISFMEKKNSWFNNILLCYKVPYTPNYQITYAFIDEGCKSYYDYWIHQTDKTLGD